MADRGMISAQTIAQYLTVNRTAFAIDERKLRAKTLRRCLCRRGGLWGLIGDDYLSPSCCLTALGKCNRRYTGGQASMDAISEQISTFASEVLQDPSRIGEVINFIPPDQQPGFIASAAQALQARGMQLPEGFEQLPQQEQVAGSAAGPRTCRFP